MNRITYLWFALIWAALAASGLHAQNHPWSFTLIDAQTAEPILFAHYQYGEQQGASDEYGQFTLQFQEGSPLLLSHLEYGLRRIESDELNRLAELGSIRWNTREAQMLRPVTVVALRSARTAQTEQQQFAASEWLAHDAGQVLLQTPGISAIRKAGQYGLDPVLRGFKYDQLNIVIDGAQSCLAACPNRMDPPVSQISLNQMEQVEVIKGPHALRYGSGLGGTLLFHSQAARYQTEGLRPEARISTGYESNGGLFRTEGLVGLQGKRVSFDLNGAWSQGGNYTDGNGQEVPSAFNRGSFGGNLNWKPVDAHEFKLNLTRNIAHDVQFAALPMDLRKDETWLGSLQHEWRRPGNRLYRWNTMLSGSFVDHLMDNLLKPLEPRMMNASTAANTRVYNARTETVWEAGRNSILYAGADYRQEEATGSRVREFLMGPMAGNIITDPAWQHGLIQNTAIFAEFQRDFLHWQWVLSARLALNRAEVLEGSDAFGGLYPETSSQQVNPSISTGLTRHWSKQGLQAGFWLARSQRSGSLIERFIHFFPVGVDPYEMLGNPALRPEVNNQVDLNLRKQYAQGAFQLNLFGSYLQDFISGQIRPDLMPRIPSAPGVRQFINLSEAVLAGFEGSWVQQWPGQWQSTLHLAYTHGQDLARNEALPEIPPLEVGLQLDGHYFQGKFQPRISLRQVFAQERISPEFAEPRTDGFFLVDVQAGYQIIPQLRLSAGVQNLLDTAYAEHLSRAVSMVMPRTRILSPGRNIFVTASFSW